MSATPAVPVFQVLPVALSRAQVAGRRRAFALCWLAYAGFYLCRKNFSVAIPGLKAEAGFTTDQIAWVLFAYNCCYMLGQFANGLAAGRWSPRRLVFVGMLVAIAANLGMGFSVGFIAFLVLGAIHGGAQASGWPGTCQIMANWFRRKERGVVMAWWSTNYVLGAFLATVFATWSITTPHVFPELGWRRGFWFPAALLTGIALLFFHRSQDSPAAAGLPDLPNEAAGDPRSTRQSPAKGAAFWAEVRQLLALPTLWIAGLTFSFLKLTRYAFLFWLPVYLTEALNFSAGDAGYASSAYELGGIVGTLAAGYVSDRVFGARRFPVPALMMVALAVCFYVQHSLAQFGIVGVTLGIALCGCMTYGPDTVISGAAGMDIGAGRTSGIAVGLITGLGSIGQLLSSLVVAWVYQRYGWQALFHCFVLCALAGALLLFTQWNYGRRPTPAPSTP